MIPQKILNYLGHHDIVKVFGTPGQSVLGHQLFIGNVFGTIGQSWIFWDTTTNYLGHHMMKRTEF